MGRVGEAMQESGPDRRLVWAVWLSGFCLLSGLATGDDCSDFLYTKPSSPVLRLLKFSVEHGSCGFPFEVQAGHPGLQWNPGRPTVIILPGRRPSQEQPSWVRTMARELLAAGQGNVLAVDWLVPAELGLTDGAGQMGERLARDIQQLLDVGSSPDMFHLIGFGVGAHIAGIAGAKLHGTIGRITGLDPFAPVFSEADPSLSLDYTDGQYVDVIHTNFNPNEPVAALGISRPLGHVDFYTGSGHLLPGCPQALMEREKYLLCSHQRAYQLFTSSIRTPCHHTAFPCQAVVDFQKGLCTQCRLTGLNVCPELGFNISWLPPERPIPFQPLTAVLDITSGPAFCVTPFLLELHIGGNLSMDAQLFVQLKGEAGNTSMLLVSGSAMTEFAVDKIYQFMVSADGVGDSKTMALEFNTQRLLYLDWRKRRITIAHLLFSLLPKDKGLAYQAWNITATENQTVEVNLQRISN